MQQYTIWSRNTKKSKSKFPKFIVFICFLLAIFILIKSIFGPVELNRRVVITKWDWFSEFIEDISWIKQFWLKVRLKLWQSDLKVWNISEWNYNFTGKYDQIEFLNKIAEWPKTEYDRYTVLEWWSIYDIDYDLTNKWLIKEWEYLSFVTDPTYISKYQDRYEFLSKAGTITTMEWFLYPDTYNIDIEWNFVDQLVYLQLENFKNKVREKYSSQIASFSKLSRYDTIKMASIVEKEERSSKNRPIVAGIFMNRLAANMLIGADITLCYWLEQPYETCTSSLIAKKVSDKSNIYNTRQNPGLTPQPICNPSADSISAVLNYSNTDYYFYLHDNNWSIHYGKTNEEHNANKAKYLN